jgi:hypothetical protein
MPTYLAVPASATVRLSAMIAIRVTRGGVDVAVIHFFGRDIYDRHGWPRVQEAPGETPGVTVAHGALPAEVIAQLLDAVLRSPVTGMVGDYGYRIDEPMAASPPRPRRSRRR